MKKISWHMKCRSNSSLAECKASASGLHVGSDQSKAKQSKALQKKKAKGCKQLPHFERDDEDDEEEDGIWIRSF